MKKTTFLEFLPHIILVIILIISMWGIPVWIKTLVFTYLAWRFFTLAAGGFSCTHCWLRFFTAAMLFAFVAIQLSVKFYFAAFFLIGIDVFAQFFIEDKPNINAF